MDFLKKLNESVIIFDGAFGTELVRRGIKTAVVPELINLTDPAAVAAIHADYVRAGADVVTTNTFGANYIKAGKDSENIIKAAVKIARQAAGDKGDKFVALDLGPTGLMSEPMGSTTFEEFYEVYKSAVLNGSGADVVLIETMSDLTEARAAALAAKENCSLPVIVSMTFDSNMRTFTGVSVESFIYSMYSIADVLGVNCSLGPKQLLPIVERIAEISPKPVIVQANAGLPDADGNYNVGAEEFAEYADLFQKAGASVIGGCCGTTMEHIAAIAKKIDRKPIKRNVTVPPVVCSASRCVPLNGVKIVGERINPTGKKAVKAALASGDYGYIAAQAIEQAEAGADILDVNAGVPGIDEGAAIVKLINLLEGVTELPLQIDSTDPAVLERALRRYNGRAIVNSVSGEQRSLDTVLPLVKKYGSMVIGLTIDEKGVPKSAEERIRIAEKIVTEAAKYSIPSSSVIIDTLTLTAGAEQSQAVETLRAITEVKRRFGVKTVLGVSNISFGLPRRQIINSGFLTAALWAGLDLAIINPNVPENIQCIDAFNVLSMADVGAKTYSEKYAATANGSAPAAPLSGEAAETAKKDLVYIIKKGLPGAEAETEKLLAAGIDANAVINDYLIKALNEVGADYEQGKIFLPGLIQSAEAAKGAFNAIKKSMVGEEVPSRGAVVMATVKGDVHDIGKNIAATVLENYGFKVIDLGKNVDPTEVVSAVKANGAKLVGLSALMTTTVKNMAETIALLKKECPEVKTMVGGAVLTKEYAAEIGADFYCPDAAADVKFAEEVYK